MAQDLDRYGAVEARVNGFPHYTHPALAELLDQTVVQ